MRALGFLVICLVVILAACGDDDDDDDHGGDGTDGEGTAVAVTLSEFSITSDVASGPAGTFDFTIENTGPDDPHEFVVVKTDLDPASLPTVEDGSVDEEGEGIEVEGEVEDLEVGATETLSLDLEAGSYAFICNIVEEEEGETESHYQEGMRTAFTVE